MTNPQDFAAGTQQAWLRKRLDEAIDALMRLEILESPTVEVKPAWAAPGHYLIGKAREPGDDRRFLWFIYSDSGVLDQVPGNAASTPREAARHFSMKWQLDATRISGTNAQRLAERAEFLYALVNDQRFWSE
jgi:hypothetical protein